jgi:hypothetical protein
MKKSEIEQTETWKFLSNLLPVERESVINTNKSMIETRLEVVITEKSTATLDDMALKVRHPVTGKEYYKVFEPRMDYVWERVGRIN